MPGPSSDWTTSQLAEFVAVLSASESVKEALGAATERAAEAFGAEAAAITGSEALLASVGFRPRTAPVAELLAASEGPKRLEVPGVGACRTIHVSLDDPVVTGLVLCRSGDEDFSPQEATLLRGMGRVLVLTLRLLRTLEQERRARAKLQERQLSLERLSKIQTSISRRVPLQEVLDAITAGAVELLGAEVSMMRLLEPGDLLRLVSASGLTPGLREAHEDIHVSQGVGGRAVRLDRPVVVNDYPSDEEALPFFAAARMSAVMGAPVHGHDGEVIGSLIVGNYDPTRVYEKADQDLLVRLAAHASLAVADATIMEEKQIAEQQLVQAQKMEAIGNLAGGVAHDFNNLLFVIQTSASFLADEMQEGDPQREDVDAILDAAKRAATLTRQLLLFSRKEVITPETLEINDVLTSMEKLLNRTITHNIELKTELTASDGWVLIDRGQLEQVLLNLAVNAQDAMPRGGTLSLSTRLEKVDERAASEHPGLKPGDYVILEVADTGEGMSTEVRERVFEPFFTTKPMGSGTGLGLASVYGIIKRAGGYIRVDSGEGEGSVFIIYLPNVEARDTDRPRADVPSSAGGGETILIAEDEEAVRHVVSRQLRSAGYTVLEASSGKEALEVFDEHAGPIKVLLTDVIMPGLSGRELAQRLSEQDPGLKVIFMSGYTHDIISQEGVLGENDVLLQKPFSGPQLLEEIRKAL